MPKRIKIDLSTEQKAELERMRDSHSKPYLRERASAILKVAAGETLSSVGEIGLLKRHEPETVHKWIQAYQESGLSGLVIKKGRGRKPAYFPKND